MSVCISGSLILVTCWLMVVAVRLPVVDHLVSGHALSVSLPAKRGQTETRARLSAAITGGDVSERLVPAPVKTR